MNEKYIIKNIKYGQRSNLQRIGIFWDGEALATEGRETWGERIWRNIAADAGWPSPEHHPFSFFLLLVILLCYHIAAKITDQ